MKRRKYIIFLMKNYLFLSCDIRPSLQLLQADPQMLCYRWGNVTSYICYMLWYVWHKWLRYRVTHKGWEYKDDLKHVKYEDIMVYHLLFSSFNNFYINSTKKERNLNLLRIINIRKQTDLVKSSLKNHLFWVTL